MWENAFFSSARVYLHYGHEIINIDFQKVCQLPFWKLERYENNIKALLEVIF